MYSLESHRLTEEGSIREVLLEKREKKSHKTLEYKVRWSLRTKAKVGVSSLMKVPLLGKHID
jgi:hypothetical protein